MPDARCIVTAPLSLAKGLSHNDVAMVVAADALVRRAWALGRAAELLVPTLAGDVSTQYAFERELTREGHDLASLQGVDRDNRLVGFDEDRRRTAAEALSALSVTADLGSAGTDTAEVSHAARTAFVKLFEEGSVTESERVVSTCPRCRTALDAVDMECGEVEAELLVLRLATTHGEFVDVPVREPELLPGAVALAVLPGSLSAGHSVRVPLADREVPVIASDSHDLPSLIIPAHDADDHGFALAHGLGPVVVLDADGTVCTAGPLQGLGRYAARDAARALLEADGAICSTTVVVEDVRRCGSCSTAVVPQLGRHWFLRAADLALAAADAVRDGRVSFTPADAREAFLLGAGSRGDWCLSSSIAGGVPIPVASCVDCGKATVDVEATSSCGKCMGVLVPDPLVLDARFVASIWAVTLGGWPGRVQDPPPEETMAVVSGADLVAWVLPAIALGLRLTGLPPFAFAVVHPWPAIPATAAFDPLEVQADRRVLRMALVAGAGALDAAHAAVAALDRPAAAEVDPAKVAEEAAAGVSALDDGSPAQAAGLLASALAAGVPAEAAERLRALVLPIFGD